VYGCVWSQCGLFDCVGKKGSCQCAYGCLWSQCGLFDCVGKQGSCQCVYGVNVDYLTV